MAATIREILHPTDFSSASDLAFVHALKIALTTRARLNILHTESRDPEMVDWTAFPGVRATLSGWGLLPADSSPGDVSRRLGVVVSKVDVVDRDPVHAILGFVERHQTDLVVMASHGRSPLGRWWLGSVSGPVSSRAQVPCLLLPDGADGFVAPEDGQMRLGRVLLPVDHQPRPGPALIFVSEVVNRLGAGDVRITLLHVGREDRAPAVHPPAEMAASVEYTIRDGGVVQTIADTAAELDADLVVMPTQGHHGFLDALRGSTTEQVVRRVGRPVLAVPAA